VGTEPEIPVAGTPRDRSHCARRELGMRTNADAALSERRAPTPRAATTRTMGMSWYSPGWMSAAETAERQIMPRKTRISIRCRLDRCLARVPLSWI
jgi:hypothetical protein